MTQILKLNDKAVQKTIEKKINYNNEIKLLKVIDDTDS